MVAQAASVEDTEEWRTKEMALVAYLATKEIRYTRLERDGRSCYWYFEDTDDLRDEVDTYTQGYGSVEPTAFSENFARVKREMFAHLDGGS